MWLSGWVVLKVANSPGFKPSAKGWVSSKGLSLSFALVCTWVQRLRGVVPAKHLYFSILTRWDYNKMLKICGVRGPVCLPHAVPVSGFKLCPTKWRPATFAHLNLWMWEPVNRLNHMLASLTLKKKARASRHLGVTEWLAGRDVRRRPRNCPHEICSRCPIYVTQWTPINFSSGRGLWGVWRRYDVAGVGGGEFALRLVTRQRAAPFYQRTRTHTHTQATNSLYPSVFFTWTYHPSPTHHRWTWPSHLVFYFFHFLSNYSLAHWLGQDGHWTVHGQHWSVQWKFLHPQNLGSFGRCPYSQQYISHQNQW